MEESRIFRLIVGLGNPGDKYTGTRHNIGFTIVDELARRNAASFNFEAKWDAQTASCGGRMLMKPSTFMNLSGEAVGNYVRYFRLQPSEVLVVLDDAAIDFGELRLRRGGSSGGHNGLESILMHLGTEQVPRLRVGIGRDTDLPLEEFVLGKFAAEEREQVEELILRGADACEYANGHGVEAAMNQYNSIQTTN